MIQLAVDFLIRKTRPRKRKIYISKERRPKLDCTICNETFTPRPQVKTPKACFKPSCQAARQKANEISWRFRNREDYDGKYHSILRALRAKKLKEIVTRLLECLRIGGRMKNFHFDAGALEVFLTHALSKLGSRACKKFWTS